MKLSFSTRGWPALTFDEMLEVATDMGFSGVEVYNLAKFDPLLQKGGPFHKYNTAANGVLDTKPYGDEIHRSWVFRSVGYGNDETYWKDIISNLRMVGYDYAISIEHEDSLMSQNEGFSKAIDMLKRAVIREEPCTMCWV